MTVLSKFVVYDSDVSFPDAVLRFVRLRYPLSDEDTVCFKPTLTQVRIFPQFLRLVKEMELAGVNLPAGLFLVDPPAEWVDNDVNFVVYGDDEELLRPVHEHHDKLGDGYSFRHSTFKRKSMTLGRFREDAARVSDAVNVGDTYGQDAVENPPFSVEFFDTYFRRNERLVARFDSTFRMPKAQREKLLNSGAGLLEPPCYAANLEGSLMSDGCQVLNMNCLGTALDFVRPVYPGIGSSYVYFSQKGTMAPWHCESMSLMSMLYLGRGSAPKIWYTCADKEGFEKLAKELYPEFAEKCDQHVSHLECCVAPELVRNAGLPLSVCIQAEGSFVVTRYNVMHMVWNVGYSEACAVNLVDDDYREIGVDVLERRMYCLCDTLPELEGEFEEGDGVDEFHDIAIRRDGIQEFSIRVPRRREVVRFNLHYFRESWRAVDERRELLALVNDLRRQLGISSTPVVPLSVASSSNVVLAVPDVACVFTGPRSASQAEESGDGVSESVPAAHFDSVDESDTADPLSVGLHFGMSRELHPSKVKKLALTLKPRVASGVASVVGPSAACPLPLVAPAMVVPSASDCVAEVTADVSLEKALALAGVDSLISTHLHFCLSLHIPLPLPLGDAASPPDADVGESEVTDDGTVSDPASEVQRGGSSLSGRILRKRSLVASRGSSVDSVGTLPDASGKFACKYCHAKGFSTLKILHRHQIHSKNCVDNPRRQSPKYECADCDKKYSMKYEYTRHRRSQHRDGVAEVKKAKSDKDVKLKKAKPVKEVDSGKDRLLVQLPSTSRNEFM